MRPSVSSKSPPMVMRGWCTVRTLDDYVLISESDTVTVYQWSTRAPVRSLWTRAMHYGCALGAVGGLPVLVAFGDLGACAWDVVTGALHWRRPDVGTASDVVVISTAAGMQAGATRVEKWGGPRFCLSLETGDDIALPKHTPRRGRYLASDLDGRRHALFDGERVVVRGERGTDIVLPWKAHRDGVSVEQAPDGTTVTTKRYGDNQGLFAFGGSELLAMDTPDVVRYDEAGHVLSSWRLPDTERVVDVARHAGRWFLLVRRWPTSERVGLGEYDVRILEGDSPARIVLSNCDGMALVRGHVLTPSLGLVALDTGGSAGCLLVPPAHAFQQSVAHPLRTQKRSLGWKAEWIRDPSDHRAEEQRAASVRELLAAPEDCALPSRLRAGPIALASKVQDAFLRLRALEDANADPVVQLRELLSAEAALGWALPDLLVVLLAGRAAYLEREWALRPDKLAGTHAAGRNVVPAGLRPFAVAPARKTWLCVRGGPEDAHLYSFDEKRRESVGPFEVVEWLTRELAHARELVRRRWLSGKEHAAELLRRERRLAPSGFVPSVVLESSASTKRVRHAKFGSGAVVDEAGSGESKKLTVDFEDGTQRIIAARFLEPI